ncbi:DUF488 domain-containing protein [Syntrophorhabdus aromaticivorans]|uniref:DUF488 domain-containing protein n=1 Tax=Syntrophorhabdus aromaticivorans TaxID=328301 RepID=A0A351U5V7_9BACT|nr:DUF488 domain-containing protein [Syntrophorhabdus aromaticivorans]NLW34379.1 DUF488 domain-containing protein [Syntrophorhabdus aromaticivorans]HBA55338.1 DUF488 domain-containing protein [Syntrophorhabdus aromaticivorans]
MGIIKLKRIYDSPDKEDGFRILVDRLWPRGLTKADSRIDLWMKEIAPSNQLRKWFHHDETRWAEFKQKYFEELEPKKDLLGFIASKSEEGPVTLLFGAKSSKFNNGIALKEYLETVYSKSSEMETT